MRTHTLTPEQLDCINFPGDQLLIRGAPGSGKTTTLLYRALALAERRQSPDETIHVFSYNKTLASYARHLVAGVTDPPIIVTNFHRWAWQHLRAQRLLPSPRQSVIQDDERSNAIASALDSARSSAPPEQRHKVLERGRQFWTDEIEWIKGRMIEDLSVYEGVIRTGRVDPLRLPARRAAWQVYEAYQAELRRLRKIDFDDFALLLLHHWDEVPDRYRIDHILIDESQDFQAAQLETLSRFARQTITIVADEGQRIYKRSFTWTDLGIEVVGGGRARVLRRTFRPTRQILAFARSLRLTDSLGKGADLPPVDSGEPERDGPIPMIAAVEDATSASPHAQYDAAADLLGGLLARAPNDTIGLLARHWQALDDIAGVLDSRGVAYDRVREHDGDVITPGVKLTTFHSAKGLEFDQVALIGVDEGTVPQPPDADMTVEEAEDHVRYERRLLYVAMTRARDSLYVLHGPAPSPFLAELDPATYEHRAIAARPVPAYNAADDIPF